MLILEGEILGWYREVTEAFRLNSTPRDFLNLYTGALLLGQGHGDSLYDLQLQESAQRALLSPQAAEILRTQVQARMLPFLSPPFVALLFAPLGRVALPQAYALWLSINAVLLCGLVALLTVSFSHWSRWERLLAGSAGLSFLPSYFAVWQGQVSLCLALAFALSWLAFRGRHDGWGGLSLALLLAKPQYAAAALLYLLWQKRWRALAGFAVGVTGLVLLGVLATGPGGLSSWLRAITQATGLGSYYGIHPTLMFTWSGFLTALSSQPILGAAPSVPFLLWAGLEMCTLLLMAMIWNRQTSEPEATLGAGFSGLLIGAILLSPHTYVQDLVLLLPAGYLTWDLMRQQNHTLRSARWLAVLLGLHVFVLGLFLLRVAFHTMPYPNLFVVPFLALWLMLLAAASIPPFSARPLVPTAPSSEAALPP